MTICRTFHWLDQTDILRRLDEQVAPRGAVAVFADSSFWAAGSPWKEAVRGVIKEFLGEERRAGQGTFQHHDRPYSEIMAESPFHHVDEVTVPVHREWTTQSTLGYLYSTSFAASHLFWDRIDNFERAVKDALASHSEDGIFPEDNEFLIRIGRRDRA